MEGPGLRCEERTCHGFEIPIELVSSAFLPLEAASGKSHYRQGRHDQEIALQGASRAATNCHTTPATAPDCLHHTV